ncbi:hypothetical protein BD779DRAFT_1743702 [Infundibulicybe gibba]|nr:hypothetical protein BD779DRAFT_1743702 [Infundibulicybe gibba]
MSRNRLKCWKHEMVWVSRRDRIHTWGNKSLDNAQGQGGNIPVRMHDFDRLVGGVSKGNCKPELEEEDSEDERSGSSVARGCGIVNAGIQRAGCVPVTGGVGKVGDVGDDGRMDVLGTVRSSSHCIVVWRHEVWVEGRASGCRALGVGRRAPVLGGGGGGGSACSLVLAVGVFAHGIRQEDEPRGRLGISRASLSGRDDGKMWLE